MTREDARRINANRKRLEAEMEGEIDSLLETRRAARKSLGDEPFGIHTCGQGRRTAMARMNFRRTLVWGRPTKAKFGVLD
jgi:hypothetical protein